MAAILALIYPTKRLYFLSVSWSMLPTIIWDTKSPLNFRALLNTADNGQGRPSHQGEPVRPVFLKGGPVRPFSKWGELFLLTYLAIARPSRWLNYGVRSRPT